MGRKGKKVVYKWITYDSTTEVALLKLLEELENAWKLEVINTRPSGVPILSDITSKRETDEKLEKLLNTIWECKLAKKMKEELVYTPDFVVGYKGKEYVLEVKTKWGLSKDTSYVIRRKLFLKAYPAVNFVECIWENKKTGWKFKYY